MTRPLSCARPVSLALLIWTLASFGLQARETVGVGERPEMLTLPAGCFWMGSPTEEVDRLPSEGPEHRVCLPAFELGKREVTFAEWDACVTAGGCTHRPDDGGWGRGSHPVIHVSWEDAQTYIAWLNGKTKRHYRLPSEAEWEYAARAGTRTPFSTGSCIHTTQANYNGQNDYNRCGAKSGVCRERTQPSGSYPANPWGLHDLHGNVWEWTQDCWNANYKGAPSDGSPWTAGDCGLRILRGGSWSIEPKYLRSASRAASPTRTRISSNGFRLARSLARRETSRTHLPGSR